jgi:hypothetical protein
MKKVSLLLGTLGGAMAGYLFSNSKLRQELSSAKDAEAAGKILAKHLQRDGEELGKHVKKFVDSDDVQRNLKKAKTFVRNYADKMKKEVKAFSSTQLSSTKVPVRASGRKKK